MIETPITHDSGRLADYRKTPFPWAGGKADAAPAVWEALGDVDHYVEPFAGSLAVLMRRPHPCNRAYYSETVNDLDGFLCNAWRAIAHDPDAVAEAASWPVSEADLHARHLWLLRWREERQLEHLMGDPDWYDVRAAGWWLWGQSTWIGFGWCSGEGPWVVGADGRIEKRTGSKGVSRKRPHLSNNGGGVNRPQMREPGVSRKLPHLSNDGGGVNRPQMREPGVSRQLPHLSDNGRGVNTAAVREPGVSRKLPHLGNDGGGVNRPQMREPGVSRKLPHLSDNGRGVNTAAVREPGVGEEPEYHPMTMPELRRWLRYLAARLRHVRILHGDWTRATTSGALQSLPVRQGGHAGIFLDPPYSDEVRTAGLYTVDSGDVADAVRAWCEEHGSNPRYRIALAGFDTEHRSLVARGWREVEWYRDGFLKGGYANQGKSGTHQHRERLWLSPHCLAPQSRVGAQGSLFDA